MNTYRHTQRAPLCLLLYTVTVVLFIVGWLLRDVPPIPYLYLPLGVLILVLAASFHHLTVEDRGDRLSISFGPVPLFRRSVMYENIVSAEVGRTTILDGWGIHLSLRGGWVWNLWGRDCVVIRFKNGGTLRIGTDDAAGLNEFLCQRLFTKEETMEVDLFNLFVGPTLPPERLRRQKIGPFEVAVIDDYDHKVKGLFQRPSVNVSFQWRRLDSQPPNQDPNYPIGQMEQVVTHIDGQKGEWTVTGKAALQSDGEASILSRTPIADNGLWDLCELLTFITGRRVLTCDMLERFDPNRADEAACIPVESLLAASAAWQHRQTLAESGMVYALLSHNSALDYQFLQPKAAQQNTALNVLIDKWPLPKLPKVAQGIREGLAKAVEELVGRWEGLTDEARLGYTALLRSKVMEGPYSMLDKLTLLLRDLGVVLADDGEPVMTRVRYLNTVRNRLTHSGEMPRLKNMTQEQSDRYTVTIVGGVLQSLNKLALGKMLGFSPSGVGSLSQDASGLRHFFAEGIWNNHPIEIMDYQEWIKDPLGLN